MCVQKSWLGSYSREAGKNNCLFCFVEIDVVDMRITNYRENISSCLTIKSDPQNVHLSKVKVAALAWLTPVETMQFLYRVKSLDNMTRVELLSTSLQVEASMSITHNALLDRLCTCRVTCTSRNPILFWRLEPSTKQWLADRLHRIPFTQKTITLVTS